MKKGILEDLWKGLLNIGSILKTIQFLLKQIYEQVGTKKFNKEYQQNINLS